MTVYLEITGIPIYIRDIDLEELETYGYRTNVKLVSVVYCSQLNCSVWYISK